jgi:hypothetical protein
MPSKELRKVGAALPRPVPRGRTHEIVLPTKTPIARSWAKPINRIAEIGRGSGLPASVCRRISGHAGATLHTPSRIDTI